MTWTKEVVRERSVFADLSGWWNSLEGPASTPFLRTEWFELWCDAFVPERSRLEVVTWSHDGDLRAAFPTFVRGLRRATLSNSHSDVFDLISTGEPDTAEVVSDWLTRQPFTRLYRLDGESSLLPRHSQPGWRVIETPQAPYADLRSGIDGLKEGMGRNLKRNIARLERRLADLGELTYLDDAEGEVPNALNACLELEASGWKGDEGTAMLSRPETERFYRSLFDLARSRGWLRLSVLMVAERLVACQISIDYGGRRFLLKPAYDEGLGSYSPGKVLQWKVMQAAVSEGLDFYEFGGDSERWKLEWTDTLRPRSTVLRFADRGVARAAGTPLRILADRRYRPTLSGQVAGLV